MSGYNLQDDCAMVSRFTGFSHIIVEWPVLSVETEEQCVTDSILLCISGSDTLSCQYKVQYEEAVLHSKHGE